MIARSIYELLRTRFRSECREHETGQEAGSY